MSRESNREILAFFILGFAAFLTVCVFTHDPIDYLGGGRESVANVGGPLGSLMSYHFTSWVGKSGSYGAAGILGLLGAALFFRRRVEQWGWKLLGGTLMILTLASFEGAVFDNSGDANALAGGYFGEFVYGLLLENMSLFGTYLLLIFAAVVAFVISTDTVLYPAYARTRDAVQTMELRESISHFVGERLPRPDVHAWEEKFRVWLKDRKKVKAKKQKEKEKAKKKKKKAAAAAKKKASTKKKRTPAQKTKKPAPEVLEEELEEVEAETEASGEDEEYEYEYVDEDAEEGEDDGVEYEYVDEDEEEEDDAEAEEDEEYEYVDEEEDEEEEEEEEDDEEEDEEPEAEKASAEPETPPRPKQPLTIREPDELLRKENKKKKKTKETNKSVGPYRLPSLDLIAPAPLPVNFLDKNALTKTAKRIESTLENFKIDAQVVEVQKGPTITQFEISLAPGIKVHKIVNLSDDLAMALKAQGIRIIAPIPGKSTVGIEVPNDSRSMVGVRELIEHAREDLKRFKLPLALGRDTAGNPVIGDLGEMPHLLIAGSTGSGKSVCINSIIISILTTRTPDEVKLILVDPKMVELAQFEKIPHLLSPVVTDMKKAPSVLNWLVDKMEERYELLAMAGVRQISSYNELGRETLRERLQGRMSDEEIEEAPEHLPFVVVVIDELADLMMTAAKEVEGSITRLSQKSRAVGIHVILATQRPSVDVITGLIKANMPSRVSFRVTSRVDSRTILDRNGADKLLGKGDCLYLPPGTSDVMRVQGAFISDKEIRDVVQYAAREAEPQYNPELTRFGIEGANDGAEQDELFDDAVGIVLGSQRGSVTLLQRQLQIGYTRASRLMELMHERGLVGPFQGSKAREVYYTLEEWEKSKKRKPTAEDEAD
ncbi:MAG: DNA translocase FtsK [Planctomycetota bacterium]